jgi:hypothetical protein
MAPILGRASAYGVTVRIAHNGNSGMPYSFHATQLLESSLIVCDEMHPIMIQPLELMEAYVAAFKKVLREPNALVGD